MNIEKMITRRDFLGRAAAAALSAAVLGGCHSQSYSQSNSDSKGAGTSGTATVAVFDISTSAHAPIVEARYRDGFQEILDSATGGDTVTGYPIASVTQATSVNRFTEKFPVSKGLLGNSDKYNAAFANAKDKAKAQAKWVLELPQAKATDILNAFQVASGILDGCLNMDRHLVVFSDMVHQTEQYDFAREELTPSRTRAIIQAQRQAGLLPSLQNVTVWVAGASADPSDPADPASVRASSQLNMQMGPAQISQIQNFWIAFFEACGASLTADRYSTTLQNYPG